MTKYAKNTTVSIEKSKGELERVLIKYGAKRFATGWDDKSAVIMFTMNDKGLKFTIPIPSKDDIPQLNSYGRKRPENVIYQDYEKAQRQVWRAVVLIIKAKLESVESGICFFEQEFLPYFITADGQTIAERLLPDFDNILVKQCDLKLLTD